MVYAYNLRGMNYSRKIREAKKLIGLVIILLVSLALTGCSDDDDSSYVVDLGASNLFIDPNGRYSITYPSDWYYFETVNVPGRKRTTWHANGTGEVTLGITDWLPNGPTTKTVLEWAQENMDRLIAEGHILVKDISPIVNAEGNTGYEFTVRDEAIQEDNRISFFFNNLTEQFDLTFYYDTGYPDSSLTQIIRNFKTTDL